MPNHVESCIRFKGTKKEVSEILDTIKNPKEDSEEVTYLDFNRIIPQPLDLKEGEWYDWNLGNWDTKWNAYWQSINHKKVEQSVEFIKPSSKEDVKIYFSTARSPVYPIIKKLSEMFPKVKFEYAYLEEGNGFHGKETFSNGNIIKNIRTLSTVKKFLRS